MIICPQDGFELPGCFEIEHPKEKYKGTAKYLGVQCLTDNGDYIHRFELSNGQVIDSFMTVETIEGLEEGNEIELEFKM